MYKYLSDAEFKKPDTKGHVCESTQTERRLGVARVWGEEGTGSDYLVDMRFRFGVIKMFWNCIEMMVTQH